MDQEESTILVPGDIISVKLGDIIPADARLLEGDPLKIDQVMQIKAAPLYVNWVDVKLCFFRLLFRLQSALTGESLPMTKGPDDGVYSGSTCKQGEIEAVVIAMGVHIFFGKSGPSCRFNKPSWPFPEGKLLILLCRLAYFLHWQIYDMRK